MATASGKGGEPFKAPPADLKPLAPFLQRAHETRTADPALSYWCNYHAAQLGIPLLNTLAPDSKVFLISLMDTLEAQKKTLAGNDVVNGDDIVAKAYVENVALKVFGGADNEDRRGMASKATARRFLVAANFIEVLSNFGKLDTEMEEKLKYAKWKAADIAKALREGRKPVAGPIGGMDEEEKEVEGATSLQQSSDLDAAAAKLAGLDAHHAEKEDDYVAREMAKLTADPREDTTNAGQALALSPDGEEANPLGDATDPVTPKATRSRRAESRLSFDARALGVGAGAAGSSGIFAGASGGGEAVPELPTSTSSSLGLPSGANPLQASSPNFSMPWRGQLSRNNSGSGSFSQPDSELSAPPSPTRNGAVQGQQLDRPSSSNSHLHASQPMLGHAGGTSPGARPLPTPPSPATQFQTSSQAPTGTLARSVSSSRRGETLPMPPGGSGSTTPLVPPNFSQQPQQQHFPQAAPSAPPFSTLPSASPQPPQAPQPSAPMFQEPISAQLRQQAPTPSAPADVPLPTTLNPALTGRVQKLAKWAVSALDYDDVETARRQLREALDICEGRITSVKKS